MPATGRVGFQVNPKCLFDPKFEAQLRRALSGASPWRTKMKPASDAQKKFLKSLGYEGTMELSSSEASVLIGKLKK
jgi:hypothetical protein